jgi:putative copper resistance protein D
MSVDNALVLSRFVHYSALLYIFGRAFFPLYALAGEERAYRLSGSVFAACILAFASGVAWLFFAAASMAGSLSEALSSEMMGTVLLGTTFGKVWITHLVLVAVLAIFASVGRKHSSVSLTLLSGTVLAGLAGVGHTQTQDGSDFWVHTATDGVHLLAAGAWLGGLVPLLAILSRSNVQSGAEINTIRVLMRFSGMGYIAVAALLATGTINGWYLIGSVWRMPTSLYGQLLIAKLGLFSLMLLLAATNRFRLVPALAASNDGEHGAASLSRLRSHIIGEQLLGLLVIAIVSVLGTQAPLSGRRESHCLSSLSDRNEEPTAVVSLFSSPLCFPCPPCIKPCRADRPEEANRADRVRLAQYARDVPSIKSKREAFEG